MLAAGHTSDALSALHYAMDVKGIFDWLSAIPVFGSVPADKVTLIVALVFVLVLGRSIAKAFSSRHRGSRRMGRPKRPALRVVRDARPPVAQKPRSMVDQKEQMDAVAAMSFEKCRLLNREEFAVFRVLEDTVVPLGGYRVMAQTSLGEVIRPVRTEGSDVQRAEAFAAINSKRLDFAVIDRSGHLALAVELHGTGHHQNRAFLRDAVKREALRRAGVEMLEVQARWDAAILEAQIRHALSVSHPGKRLRERARDGVGERVGQDGPPMRLEGPTAPVVPRDEGRLGGDKRPRAPIGPDITH
ncbi:MAG: DUF2726 domain-containing protein [Pseudomonadota bacterium]